MRTSSFLAWGGGGGGAPGEYLRVAEGWLLLKIHGRGLGGGRVSL